MHFYLVHNSVGLYLLRCLKVLVFDPLTILNQILAVHHHVTEAGVGQIDGHDGVKMSKQDRVQFSGSGRETSGYNIIIKSNAREILTVLRTGKDGLPISSSEYRTDYQPSPGHLSRECP